MVIPRPQSYFQVKQFSPWAPQLRAHFDGQFADPKDTHNTRFQWDYWHVPEQYTLVRTPAYHYFPDDLYMKFHKDLVMWGRRTLGCWDISPPWLSYYVEGCKQSLHSDVPHGPWAFVYSLAPRKQKFSGGETLLLKPETLDYWQNMGAAADREQNSFVSKVPSKFNNLLVFDPRVPHGVSEVRGTHDPREARLVIHGWFTNPKTFIDGVLPKASTEKILNRAFEQVVEFSNQHSPFIGCVSVQVVVGRNGKPRRVQFLTNNLVSVEREQTKNFSKKILSVYQGLEFAAARSETSMTIPLLFS